MVSAIDSTRPVDGLSPVKAELRANLEAARTEIEALQEGKADKPIDFVTDIASTTPDRLCGTGSSGDPELVQVGSGLAYSSGVLSSTGTATPSLVAATPTAGVYALSDAVRFLASNVVLNTDTDNTDIEVPENYLTPGEVAIFQVLVNNSGCTVSIQNDPSGRVLNGVTDGSPIALGPAGSTVTIIALPNNVVRVEGETAEARTLLNDLDANGNEIQNVVLTGASLGDGFDANGQAITANLAGVVTSVSGALTNAHLGRLIVTSGDITVPATEGFHCLVKAGGAHTVTFNSTVSAPMTSGDVYSIFVQSTAVIIMTPGATPVAFS